MMIAKGTFSLGLVSLLAFFLFPILLTAQNTVISGKQRKKNKELVTVWYYANPIDEIESKGTYIDSEVDENGLYKINLKIEHPVSVCIEAGNDFYFYNMFILPGDSLYIEDKRRAMNISGKGAERFAFQISYQDFNRKLVGRQPNRYSLGPVEYMQNMKLKMDEQLRYYHENTQNIQMPDSFKHIFEAEIKYYYATFFFQYSWINPHSEINFYTPNKIAEYMKGIAIEDPSAIFSPYYGYFLRELPYGVFTSIANSFQNDSAKKTAIIRNNYHLRDSVAKTYFTGPSYDIALYSILFEYLNGLKYLKGSDKFDPASLRYKDKLQEYKGAFSDTSLYTRILDCFDEILKSNVKAFDFVALDTNGKEVRLSDFAGKVVYIDFWATTCAPCVAELPATQRLQKKFKDNEDLVFLYVSFDRATETALNFISENDFKGIHLIEPKGMRSEVAGKYAIQGIPRYMLIDKKGLIINDDAPRPSSHPEDLIQNALFQ